MITKASTVNDITVLTTNTFIDRMTGIGGLPRGRIVEIWGDQNTGKSSVCLQTIVAAQKQGLRCLWVDVEYSFSLEYAKKLGVDVEKLGILRESYAEDIIDQTEEAIESGEWDVIVFDSIGDLSSRVQKEKSSGEKTIGVQASLMTRFSVNIAPHIVYNKILFIGVNHSRTDIMTGKLMVLGGKKWSEKKKLSIRFREKTGAILKKGDEVVGRVIIAKVTKNHLGGTDGLEVEARLMNNEGFSTAADLFETALSMGIIRKEGNTHFIGDEKLGTLSKAREWVKENEETLKERINS